MRPLTSLPAAAANRLPHATFPENFLGVAEAWRFLDLLRPVSLSLFSVLSFPERFNKFMGFASFHTITRYIIQCFLKKIKSFLSEYLKIDSSIFTKNKLINCIKYINCNVFKESFTIKLHFFRESCIINAVCRNHLFLRVFTQIHECDCEINDAEEFI